MNSFLLLADNKKKGKVNDSDVVSTLKSAIFLVNGNVCTSFVITRESAVDSIVNDLRDGLLRNIRKRYPLCL
jgi:hypothetical protein